MLDVSPSWSSDRKCAQPYQGNNPRSLSVSSVWHGSRARWCYAPYRVSYVIGHQQTATPIQRNRHRAPLGIAVRVHETGQHHPYWPDWTTVDERHEDDTIAIQWPSVPGTMQTDERTLAITCHATPVEGQSQGRHVRA